MKVNNTLVGLVVLSAVTFLGNVVCGQEVQWLRSADEAARTAAKTGKPILVYVRSANCHYCDLMQKNVWQDPASVDLVTRYFVPLKLTHEENAEAIEVLQIKGFPSTLVFSADKKFLDRMDGYVAPERFLATMQKLQIASSNPATPQRR